MKTKMCTQWRSLLAVSMLGGLSIAEAQPRSGRSIAEEAGRLGWFSNWEQAKKEGQKQDKPLMVVLRCGP